VQLIGKLNKEILGKYKNKASTRWVLYTLGGIVTLLNVMLLISFI